jgi:hypothetical protein
MGTGGRYAASGPVSAALPVEELSVAENPTKRFNECDTF